MGCPADGGDIDPGLRLAGCAGAVGRATKGLPLAACEDVNRSSELAAVSFHYKAAKSRARRAGMEAAKFAQIVCRVADKEKRVAA